MLKWVLVFVLLFGTIGYFAYNAIVHYGANKLVDQVAAEIVDNKDADKLMDDPEIENYIKDGGDLDELAKQKDLPFHTKEEALKTVIKKVGMDNLKDMKDKALDGVSPEERQEIEATLNEKLSPKEMEALKLVALKEIKKRQQEG
ncbi:hypothetical protein [Fictibacillus terranigra]|uniref:Phenylalanyl-tRNA synthetase subunit beta n=1 Tax=Fictibacillus terranigra TaxID=3058424 RepID=A0ABT8E1Z6_9BACL|nr:hypothetical protein [Fictibacillus sp. CENA-BCM004]MDN4071934.1 hypothetical protein [Fictibacillus sp. CENA-BCM004]